MSFISELKRRNVVRVGIAYVLIAWVLLQAADFGLDLIDAPNWVIQALFLVALIGLPAALIFSWIFEMTPEGLKRDADVIEAEAGSERTTHKLDRVIIGALALLVVGLIAERFLIGPPEIVRSDAEQATLNAGPETGKTGKTGKTGEMAQAAETSIAVLPFVNMSADADNEFFSDGVSEEILNVLAQAPDLKVAARTSSFSYKGRNEKVSVIAEELGVDHVLEGSVRKAGNQVRVTAQLIQASDGFHLWSETYDRELDNIFAIQDDIAGQIATALQVSLRSQAGPAENLTGTTNLEAYEHYLRGIGRWHERTADSLRDARDAFEAATALDPDFAKAHAGLAMTLTVWPSYIRSDFDTLFTRAGDHARRALELDPNSFEAHAVLGGIAARDWKRWAESVEHFETAIALNPSFATAYQWFSRLRQFQGAHEEARALIHQAQLLDPRSRIIMTNLAWAAYTADDIDAATREMEAALDAYPGFPEALSGMIVLATVNGQCAQVASAANTLVRVLRKTVNRASEYVALCEAGRGREAADLFAEILSWGPFDYANPDSPHLLYNIEFWMLSTQLEAFEAAAIALEDLKANWGLGVLGWLRNDLRPPAIEFNCTVAAQAIYAASNTPPPRNRQMCSN